MRRPPSQACGSDCGGRCSSTRGWAGSVAGAIHGANAHDDEEKRPNGETAGSETHLQEDMTRTDRHIDTRGHTDIQRDRYIYMKRAHEKENPLPGGGLLGGGGAGAARVFIGR